MLATQKTTQTDKVLGTAHATRTISINIPSKINFTHGGIKVTLPINGVIRQSVIDEISRNFALEFGGASLSAIEGLWIDSDNGNLIRESITRIESYASKLTVENLTMLYNTAIQIKDMFNQDSVLIGVDGFHWFV